MIIHNNPYINLKDLNNYSKDLICLAGGQFGSIKNYYKNFK